MIRENKKRVFLFIFLSFLGGAIDSYSYFIRDHVFSNAQTGNIVLLGVNIYNKDINGIIKYGTPILLFSIGIVIGKLLKFLKIKYREVISLIIEIFFLIIGILQNKHMNLMGSSLCSLACGIQLETFDTLLGLKMYTTMCIGNLKSMIEKLLEWILIKDIKYIKECGLYFLVIISFIAGGIVSYKIF